MLNDIAAVFAPLFAAVHAPLLSPRIGVLAHA
jgi:hypothetical protein